MLVCDNPVCDQDIDARTEAERHKKSGKCVTSRMQAQACTPKHLIWLYQTDYTRPWPRHGRARCPTGRLSMSIDMLTHYLINNSTMFNVSNLLHVHNRILEFLSIASSRRLKPQCAVTAPLNLHVIRWFCLEFCFFQGTCMQLFVGTSTWYKSDETCRWLWVHTIIVSVNSSHIFIVLHYAARWNLLKHSFAHRAGVEMEVDRPIHTSVFCGILHQST
jgi:hypothetical protein